MASQDINKHFETKKEMYLNYNQSYHFNLPRKRVGVRVHENFTFNCNVGPPESTAQQVGRIVIPCLQSLYID